MIFWVYTAIQVDLQDFPAPYLYRGSLWPWRLVICWMMKTMVTTVSRILTRLSTEVNKISHKFQPSFGGANWREPEGWSCKPL